LLEAAGASRLLLICAVLLVTSCADYRSGYEHGYKNMEPRSWLVLGREKYEEGYQEGHMQAFQDDWYAENADEIVVGKICWGTPGMSLTEVNANDLRPGFIRSIIQDTYD